MTKSYQELYDSWPEVINKDLSNPNKRRSSYARSCNVQGMQGIGITVANLIEAYGGPRMSGQDNTYLKHYTCNVKLNVHFITFL